MGGLADLTQLRRNLPDPCANDPLSQHLSALAGPPPICPPLDHDVRVDVVVVGAGFTGLSAALFLAEAGAHPLVLEASQIGNGGSGRAFGQVAPYTKHMPAAVEIALGAVAGARLNAAAAAGPDLVFSLADRHGMRASVRRSGIIVAAHTPTRVAGLARTVEDLQRRGHPAHLLDRDATAKLVGSNLYYGALYDERGGSINPLGYARGLAWAALGAGATIHTETPVTGLRQSQGRWRLDTPGGTVSAETVILATNAFTHGLWPDLDRTVIPMRAYQFISAPLTDNVLATILPERQPLCDTRRLFSGVRVLDDGRLHVSLDGPAFDPGGRPFMAKLDRRMHRLFPQLTELRWESGWGGWVDMTADQFPHLHRLAPGLLAGLGFSGRGIAMGTTMGRDLASLATGATATELAYPITEPRPLWFHRLAQPAITALLSWYRLNDSIDEHRYMRHAVAMQESLK